MVKKTTKHGGVGSSDRRKAAIKIQKMTRKNAERKAAIKIQKMTRKNTAKKELDKRKVSKNTRREKAQENLTDFKKELTKGAPTYKKTLKTINIQDATYTDPLLSTKPLEQMNFKGVDFSGPKCRFVGAKISGSNFSNANLKNCDLSNAIAKNTNFNFANLENVNLSGKVKFSDFTGASFKNANMRGIIINQNTILKNNDITGASFSTLSTTKFFDHKKDEPLKNIRIRSRSDNRVINIDIKDKTFINVNINKISFHTVKMESVDFKNGNFIECYWNNEYSKDGIIDCNFENIKIIKNNFSNMRFINNNFKNIAFDKILFSKCYFNNCNFENVELKSIKLDYMLFDETNFINSNLMSSSFNASTLKTVSFENSKLNGCQFIPMITSHGVLLRPIFSPQTIFRGADLRFTTFQQCKGMTELNFSGVDLSNASFSGGGVDGLDLIRCNFRNAILNNVTFRNVVFDNCDFTDAVRDEPIIFTNVIGQETNHGHTNLELGYDNEVAIYPSDIHAAYHIANIPKLYDTIKDYIPSTLITPDKFPKSNNEFVKHINDIFKNIILNISVPTDANDRVETAIVDQKARMTNELLKLVNDRIESYDYNNLYATTMSRISWGDLIFIILQYVNQQTEGFKEIYFGEVITESYNTYGAGGLSCIKGLNERFIVKLRSTMLSLLQSNAVSSTDKIIEFHKIINIIDPTAKKPETPSELDQVEEPYFEMEVTEAIRDQWYKLHNSESDDPFNEDSNIDDVMINYSNFLKDRFNYHELTPGQKIIFDRKIQPDISDMRKLLDEAAGLGYLFGGGKMMRRSNPFSLSTKEFNRLWKKINGNPRKKTKRKYNKKSRSTRINRSTRRNR